MQELGNFFIGKSFGRKKSRPLSVKRAGCFYRFLHRVCSAFREPFAEQKENRPENSQSGIFKSATTYFHKPFPANYLGHE